MCDDQESSFCECSIVPNQSLAYLYDAQQVSFCKEHLIGFLHHSISISRMINVEVYD